MVIVVLRVTVQSLHCVISFYRDSDGTEKIKRIISRKDFDSYATWHVCASCYSLFVIF